MVWGKNPEKKREISHGETRLTLASLFTKDNLENVYKWNLYLRPK